MTGTQNETEQVQPWMSTTLGAPESCGPWFHVRRLPVGGRHLAAAGRPISQQSHQIRETWAGMA